jgi:hypothetical protein
MNSTPEIESIEFVGNPFGDLDPNAAKEVTPQRFMDEYNNRLRHYPDGPVAVGDKWERTEEVQIGSGQMLKFKKEFTYLGTEEKSGTTFDKVGVKSLTVDYEIGEGGQLPLKLDESNLEVASSEGVLLYDRKLKMFTSEAEKLQIKGTLTFTIDINGQKQKFPGNLDLTIEAKQTSEPKSK